MTKTSWTGLPARLALLVLSLLIMSQQHQPLQPSTRALGPGFAVLEQARLSRATGQYATAARQALEAGRLFEQRSEWLALAGCYEEVYQCACDLDSLPFYQELITRFTDMAALLSDKGPEANPANAFVWGRLGSLHHTLGAYDDALTCYEKALPFAEQAADTFLLPRLYGSAAMLYWFAGDDYRSLSYQEKALVLAGAQRDTPLIAAITTYLGNVWRTLDPPKSIPFFQQAVALDPQNSEAEMLLSKAYEEVEKDYTKAMRTARAALGLARDDTEMSDALHQVGRVFFAMGRYTQALECYGKALPFARRGYGSNHPECAKIHLFIGNALSRLGQYGAALSAYNQTLDDLLPLFSPANADANPELEEMSVTSFWIPESLLEKAQVYENRFQTSKKTSDLERSLECAEKALDYLQKIKLRYGDDRSKFELDDCWQSACSATIHTALALAEITGDPEYTARAFRICEQNKAVVLAESLYKKELKRIAGIPMQVLEKERACYEEIAYFEKKLSEDNTIAWKDSLFGAIRQKELLEKQIEDQYPAYSEALFGYRNTLSPERIQQQMPHDAAVVEYFWGDSALYTFLITPDTLWAEEQPLTENLRQTLAAFRRSASDWQYAGDSSASASLVFLQAGHPLFQSLLAKPLALTNSPRLFVVPDGPLHYLPFDLLLTKPYTGQWIDREAPFLLKDKSVSYRFSCKSTPDTRDSEGWGGFGMEYDEQTLSYMEGPEYTATASGLALRNNNKLPFADDEIIAISGILGGAFWLNELATRDNFLQNAEKYGILHLALHGFVDERNPLRSRLLFAKSGTGADPFVYASDLYNLQLRAGLTVLSACQSGTGAWKRGEGVMSLARAFAFAGCPSLVMSLWNVSDQSTSDLMVEFYKQLKAGKTKDEALRAAKLQYLQTASPEYAKPVYWAGFVPVGEMNALPESYFSSGKMKWLWRAGGLVLLCGFLFWLIRKIKRR